jgi:transposase
VKIDEERDDRILELYEQEYSGTQIAKMLFIGKATVYDALKRRGVRRRPRGGPRPSQMVTYHEREHFRMLYQDQKLSIREIADLTGLPFNNVKSRLIRWRIARRSSSEALRLAKAKLPPEAKSAAAKKATAGRDFAELGRRGGKAKARNLRNQRNQEAA